MSGGHKYPEMAESFNSVCPSDLEHGFVLRNNCQQCSYFCLPPYQESSPDRFVECDVTSGKWLTKSGEEPCVRLGSTTKKMFDFDWNAVDSSQFNYQNNFDLNGYQTNKPPNLDIPSDKFLEELKVPTVAPFKFNDVSDQVRDDTGSGAVFGIIVAGVITMMIFVIFIRVWVARCAARRREERIHQIVEQLNSRSPQTRGTRMQQQSADGSQLRIPNDPSLRRATERPNDGVSENDEGMGIVIVRIRRFFRIASLLNPYSSFQDPPEPPPYDAESVPPPAYEETESTGGSVETCQQPTGAGPTDSGETPADPPPPYSVNVV